MFKLEVETIKGIVQETVYNVDDFPYKAFAKCDTVYKYPKSYYNISASFDIESTTIEPPKIENEYLYTPYAFMYHWQLCIKDKVVFGRTWEEFQLFIKRLRRALRLNSKRYIVIYVHNLAYEFQFFKEFITIESLFAKDKKKPIKVDSRGIQWRCSYMLSNMSLAKFCENSELATYYKMEDKFDYRKLRTPKTPLTKIELQYCYNDVRGLCQCIDTLLQEDTITTIPLTNTGYVRREYRNAMRQNKNNRRMFENSTLTPEQYLMLKKAFRGGNTHANYRYSNLKLENVYSFDISSSYPSAMMMDDFPMGRFSYFECDSQEKLEYFCENFCCVFKVTFYYPEMKETSFIPYIDIAHCEESSGIVNDNGRVLKANLVTLTLTNIDLEIIRNTYNYEGFEIHESMYAEKGKLPKELREKLMHFFELKTKLKGIDGKEYEYMKSKNKVNSTFGMMVTDIANSEVYYEQEEMVWNEIEPDLASALEKFYGSRNNFLCYQWGVFVTANARKRLQIMLDKVGKDVVYIDTDSIKFINEQHIKEFEEYNKILEEQAENNDISAYVDRLEKDGTLERYYLGTWDNDGNYIRFKTLGAKKYCYEKLNKKGEKVFEITVSGMSKKKGAERVGTMENFQIGKTYHDIGRTTSWYNDKEIHKITVDGVTFTTASNIGILDTSYTLGVTMEYLELIEDNI